MNEIYDHFQTKILAGTSYVKIAHVIDETGVSIHCYNIFTGRAQVIDDWLMPCR